MGKRCVVDAPYSFYILTTCSSAESPRSRRWGPGRAPRTSSRLLSASICTTLMLRTVRRAVAIVAGHLPALEHVVGIGTAADAADVAVHLLHAVRRPLAFEVVPLHGAGGAAALAGADDVDRRDLREDVDLEFLADLEPSTRAAKLANETLGSQSALGNGATPAAARRRWRLLSSWRRGRDRRGWQGDEAYPDSLAEPPRSRLAAASSPAARGRDRPGSPSPGSPGRSGRKSASSRPCGRVVQLSSLLPLSRRRRERPTRRPALPAQLPFHSSSQGFGVQGSASQTCRSEPRTLNPLTSPSACWWP